MCKFIKTKLCIGTLLVFCGFSLLGCSSISTDSSNANILNNNNLSNEALQMSSLDINRSYANTGKNIESQPQDDENAENVKDVKPQAQDDEIIELVNQYYAIKAERESYKLDKDILKQQKKDGTISQDNYRSQRENLEETIDDLHLAYEQLWQELISLGWKPENVSDSVDVANLSDQELRDSFYTLRQQHDDIDRKKEALEFQYYSGQLNRTEFITQYAELEYESDQTYWEMEPMIDELNYRNAWSPWNHNYDHDRYYDYDHDRYYDYDHDRYYDYDHDRYYHRYH